MSYKAGDCVNDQELMLRRFVKSNYQSQVTKIEIFRPRPQDKGVSCHIKALNKKTIQQYGGKFSVGEFLAKVPNQRSYPVILTNISSGHSEITGNMNTLYDDIDTLLELADSMSVLR